MRLFVPDKAPSFFSLVIPAILATGLTSAANLPITAYTTAEGLAHNHINRIRQDSRGYLWFCTDGGLSRFDGYRFKNYTMVEGLPHPWVNDLLEARDGTYWIATDGGVCRFNPNGHASRHSASDRAQALSPSDKPSAVGSELMFVVYHPSQQEDANRVNALVEDPSGAIWCATNAGLYRLQPGGNVAFQSMDLEFPRNTFQGRQVNNLALDGDGTLWIAAREGLFRRLRDGRTERYSTVQGLPDKLNYVETVFRDQSGRWWIGTRGRGFCSVVNHPAPGTRVTAACYSTLDGLPGNDVRSIFQSSTGALWIGTLGGLSEFNPVGPRFRNYTVANGLSSAVVYKIDQDRDGNLWIGTRDDGVMKMAANGFVTYGLQDGLRTGNADAEIFEGLNGELFVITSVGAHAFIERFDGTRFNATEIGLLRADPLSAVWLRPGSFQGRSGEWWVATTDGFHRFPKTNRAEDLGHVRPNFIYDVIHGLQGSTLDLIYPDTRGGVWIATGKYNRAENYTKNDLTHWERATGNLKKYLVTELPVGLSKNAVTALQEDTAGDLWIGFDRADCLLRYRRHQFETFQCGQEAFKGMIRKIFVDHRGRVWVASTQGGLSRIDHPDADYPGLTRYTTADGLSSNEIRCITEDRFGRIYVGTNRGVDRLDPVVQDAGSEPLRVQHYTWLDGLAKGTVHFAFCDRRGTLWFVTNDGISRLAPDPGHASEPPPILITGLKIMGVPQSLSQLGETDIAGLKLPPSRNEIEIEFLSINFRRDADLRYQYMLEGTSEHWSIPTDERTVHYAGLTPGEYRFLVRAVGPDGRPSSQPAVLSFALLKPFWRRWWFIGLEAMAFALVVFGLSRYRLVQLLAVERIRTRIATDLHDDIGSSLSRVAILSEVVRQRVGEADPEINAPLASIAEISRELIDSMAEIVWAINPAKDNLYFLTQRMREFGNDVFLARGIQFEFRASSSEHELGIGADVRRQVFLIYKECAHNIIRHANCTHVEVVVRVEGGGLVVRVRDNGTGFEPLAAINGHGLASMRNRAQRLGGRIDVATDGQGTAVTLEVPLEKTAA